MAQESGVRVTVQGSLPPEAMEKIANSVKRAVLAEVATLDLAPPLREVPITGPDNLGGAVIDALPTDLAELRGWLVPLGLILESELPQ